jgi:multiple sugar transport system substrate-binding protein/sn-glycerol 3-phosphate transport system substrate-binding protein
VQYSGGYSEIYQKTTNSIAARRLPGMAVAYESMTTEYAHAGAVVPLDPYLADPETGLTGQERADFFPVVLETNRYAEFDGAMLSFPFTKSVLMMYFNRDVLAKAGFDAPPATWEAFLAQCRKVKEVTGKPAYAVDVDASTMDGVIFSMGGDVYADGETLFDQPHAVRAFELFETLAKEELAYQIPPGSYDDRLALAAGDIAFSFRSSSHRAYVAEGFDGDTASWGMARIPQADPEQPRTVLYGANVCVFKTTPEQQQTAWEFIRYFTSPEVTARWAVETGYLPIRKSAAQQPALQAFWEEAPQNRAAFDCLDFAVSEPNVGGWQEVRDLIERAQTVVLLGRQTGQEAARELKEKADAVLAGYGS